MRFYQQSSDERPHRFYCGIDLHARSMYLCILDQAGTVLLHQNFAADPAAGARRIFWGAAHSRRSRMERG